MPRQDPLSKPGPHQDPPRLLRPDAGLQASPTGAPSGSQESPLLAPPESAVLTRTSVGAVQSWQRAAGNAAVAQRLAPSVVQRVPPTIQRVAAVHHTEAEIRAMTLAKFDEYARKQADWENEPGKPAADAPMSDAVRTQLRGVLEWGRGKDEGVQAILLPSAVDMTVTALLATGLTDPGPGKSLRAYAIAAAKAVPHRRGGHHQDDVDKARKIGDALVKLEPALTQRGLPHSAA